MHRIRRIVLASIAAGFFALLIPCAPAQTSSPSSPNAGVVGPKLLTHVAPQYPAEAKEQGVVGTVILHLIITTEGDVTNVTVISGPDILQQAAVDAVQQWKFQPATKYGIPTAVDTRVTVNFAPSDSGN